MKKTIENKQQLAQQARQMSLMSIYNAGSGHPGGTLSSIDILVEVLHEQLDITPQNQLNVERDRFVLSKGHSAPALYAIANQLGLMSEHEMLTLRQLGSPAQGHPDQSMLSWLDASTGSLGQGFSNAVGMAMGNQLQNFAAQTIVVLGDGELQEGQVWEAAMCASHFKLRNLTAVIDYNKLQSDDFNENIMGLEPLSDKFSSFGWHTQSIDGHDFYELSSAFNNARNSSKPSVIIANTVKGKGVSYMENIPSWHGSVEMTESNIVDALTELGVESDSIPAFLEQFSMRWQ